MKNLLTFALLFCFSLYFIACKSNDAPSPATPTPDATACTLKKIVYTNHASLSAIEFAYNTTKRLTKVTKTALKSADSQIDSLEYNAKGQLFRIYTMAASTKKISSVILIEYDANSKPITINRSNSDYKDNFIYDQNNQTVKIESSYKLPYTSETDTYTFEYDKRVSRWR